jgi:hypothetical protein
MLVPGALRNVITELLAEETRMLRARSARLIEQAAELVVQARALRAQRAFIQAAGFAPPPSGT